MKKYFILGLAFSALMTANSYAFQVEGTTPASAVITKKNHNLKSTTASEQTTGQVYLMKIQLTPQEQAAFMSDGLLKGTGDGSKEEAEEAAALGINMPTSVEIPLQGVPVLDQGAHGSCVTFSVSASLDSLMGKGDYVSPLCSLALGKHLEETKYVVKGYEDYLPFPSGWDGSFGPLVLTQMKAYGFVTMADQREKSCGGLNEYPLNDMYNTGKAMTLADYSAMSNKLDKFEWKPLLTVVQRMGLDPTYTYDANRVLAKVKAYLAYSAQNKGPKKRLIFGAQVPNANIKNCTAGACGKYKKVGDSWVLFAKLDKSKNPNMGGHEMIITGFDNDAVAVDNEGKKHKGLLKLRSSWSDKYGDNGDFYMSYDYFKRFVSEVQTMELSQ